MFKRIIFFFTLFMLIVAYASDRAIIRSKFLFPDSIFCKKYLICQMKQAAQGSGAASTLTEQYFPDNKSFNLTLDRRKDSVVVGMALIFYPDDLSKSQDIRANKISIEPILSDFTQTAIGIPFRKLPFAKKCFEVFTTEAFKSNDYIDRNMAGGGRIFRFKNLTDMVRITCWASAGLVNGYYLNIEAVNALPNEK